MVKPSSTHGAKRQGKNSAKAKTKKPSRLASDLPTDHHGLHGTQPIVLLLLCGCASHPGLRHLGRCVVVVFFSRQTLKLMKKIEKWILSWPFPSFVLPWALCVCK